jgi:predicted O-methyltransferase YrrM
MDESNIRASLGVRQYHFEDADVKNKITCLFGDSAEFDFSPFRRKADFFFIDGAHSYDYVKSDTFNALKCCHPGSVIAWHDYGRSGVNGVTKWLHELAKENKIYSIPGGSVAFMVVE